MRCGFEDEGLLSTAPIASITAKVLGNHGNEVTAVLGNAQGGLELLPSQAYGNDWLHVTHRGMTEMSLPQKGDPYEEIYKVKDQWYGLLIEDWINPAGLDQRGWKNTMNLLEKAKAFHKAIEHTHHPVSMRTMGLTPPMRPGRKPAGGNAWTPARCRAPGAVTSAKANACHAW